jgi:hypothetical protein
MMFLNKELVSKYASSLSQQIKEGNIKMAFQIKARQIIYEVKDGELATINPGEKVVVSNERADYLESIGAARKLEEVEDDVPDEQTPADGGKKADKRAKQAPAGEAGTGENQEPGK